MDETGIQVRVQRNDKIVDRGLGKHNRNIGVFHTVSILIGIRNYFLIDNVGIQDKANGISPQIFSGLEGKALLASRRNVGENVRLYILRNIKVDRNLLPNIDTILDIGDEGQANVDISVKANSVGD